MAHSVGLPQRACFPLHSLRCGSQADQGLALGVEAGAHLSSCQASCRGLQLLPEKQGGQLAELEMRPQYLWVILGLAESWEGFRIMFSNKSRCSFQFHLRQGCHIPSGLHLATAWCYYCSTAVQVALIGVTYLVGNDSSSLSITAKSSFQTSCQHSVCWIEHHLKVCPLWKLSWLIIWATCAAFQMHVAIAIMLLVKEM